MGGVPSVVFGFRRIEPARLRRYFSLYYVAVAEIRPVLVSAAHAYFILQPVAFGGERLEFQLLQLDAVLFGEGVQREKARVVPGEGVFLAGIAEPAPLPGVADARAEIADGTA